MVADLKRSYKGRSINKLQNSAILLIFQILQIRNMRFVGNFIVNTCKIFIIMTSLM